ncbi:hypothetical protein [Plantactinospora sp. GCM10030261]|uniref:hypothetical protein n=1 Tax=Plantactinospora sp. GCM10030261 TaxID=3273420 RepID=UPI00361C158A
MKRTLTLSMTVLLTVAAGLVATVGSAAAGPPAPRIITVAGPEMPTPRAAVSSTVTAKIHHYNICNAKRDACTIEQAAVAQDVLVWLVKSDGAWFVSINESCISSFRSLANRLGAAGTFVVSRQKVTNCCPGADPLKCRPGNQEFGNALFHPGGVQQDGKAWFLPNPGKDCTDPETECRTMLCLKFNTFAGPMGQCAAHLGGRDEGETIDQAIRYFSNAADYMEAGRRYSIAGDFNLTPDKLPSLYDSMENLVLGNTFPTRPAPNRQIDYIFVQDFGTTGSKAGYCPTNASDHCYTSGDWRPLDS